jgi:TPR repeat protein
MNHFKCEAVAGTEAVDLKSAFFEIGMSLLNQSESSDQNNSIAAVWFALSTMNGDIRSKTSLGLMLVEGRGLPEDFDVGIRLLREVAETGDKNAQEAVYFFTNPEGEYTCECCRAKQMN